MAGGGAERSTSTRPSRPPGSRRSRAARLGPLVYVAPALVVYLLFAVLPALNTVYLSFLDWDGVSPSRWVGLGNYVEVFRNPLLLGAIRHSLVLIFFFSVLPVGLGLVATGLLMGKVRRGMTFFRVVFFLPQVLPLVAVGITWRWLYSQDGLVNQLLDLLHLHGLTRAWLGDVHVALIAIGLVGTWTMGGLCMTLFLAGAQKIDPALHEAATMDGANALRRFLSITIPELRGEITVAAVITTIAALASFDLIFVSTNGGPANSTTVPALLVYRLAFNESDIGQASALAVTLSVLVVAFVAGIRLVTRERA